MNTKSNKRSIRLTSTVFPRKPVYTKTLVSGSRNTTLAMILTRRISARSNCKMIQDRIMVISKTCGRLSPQVYCYATVAINGSQFCKKIIKMR